jgi:hypothetical protein
MRSGSPSLSKSANPVPQQTYGREFWAIFANSYTFGILHTSPIPQLLCVGLQHYIQDRAVSANEIYPKRPGEKFASVPKTFVIPQITSPNQAHPNIHPNARRNPNFTCSLALGFWLIPLPVTMLVVWLMLLLVPVPTFTISSVAPPMLSVFAFAAIHCDQVWPGARMLRVNPLFAATALLRPNAPASFRLGKFK